MPALPPAPDSATPAGPERWFYHHQGHVVGPVSTSEIQLSIANGLIDSYTMIWSAETGRWVPIVQTRLARYLVPAAASAATAPLIDSYLPPPDRRDRP